MSAQLITVFGGTGFLGRSVVRHLQASGFSVRAASRRPDRWQARVPNPQPNVESWRADINDDESISAAIRDAFGVVNAVSLYVEHGRETFRSIHVEAAGRLAKLAHLSGVERMVHVSGIGSDMRSASSYIRSRGEGEEAVKQAFAAATMIRPAVMAGPDDSFVTPLLKMLRAFPIFPMFGHGKTRLQPAYVEDVAEAIARTFRAPTAASVYELAGPRIYTYKALLQTIAAGAGKRPILFPFPFALWHALGYIMEFVPSPALTRNQIQLMQMDNVASPDTSGFETLQISPQALETVLPKILKQVIGIG